MYLKKVEVFGFKSFADKTVLILDKGITVIVGPNGCGKSNISEAISWCLGEQRAKNIRIPSMQSVIFGGTQKRPSLGMTEVSLTFDNSQNVLPIDYSEVMITRKLFRNGESQYFINKSQCRLKDIRDLFLDTGIGPDGYSIIAQGKVDSLVSSISPEDRRELFEEAAGIAKYKARREETIKRLERVESDMARLSDALSLQKEQINVLDKQARKAKQYKKYQDELKKYEAADLVWQINFGNEEIAKIKETLDPKIKEYEMTTTLSAQMEAEIADMRLNLDQKNDNYVALNGELSDIRTTISVSDQIVQSASQRETELRLEQERLSLELSENKEKTSQYQKELNDTGADDAALMTEIQNLEQDFKDKEQKFNDIKTKLSSFSTQTDEFRIKLSEVENQKENQTNAKAQALEKYVRLDAETASLKRNIERLESDIEPSQNEIAAMTAELNDAIAETSQKAVSQEELDKEIASSELKESKLQEEISELKNNIASNEGSIETFREFEKSNPIRLAMRAVIDTGAARGPISGLIDMDPENEDIAALALGDKLDYLVCKDLPSAQKAINYLEENGFAKLSFIIEDKVPEVKELARLALPSGSAELIKLLKFNRADEKIIRFLCSNAIVLGGTIYSETIVCGGGKIAAEKPVLIEDKIKRLEDKNEEIKKTAAELEKNIEETLDNQINLKMRKDEIFRDIARLNAQIENKREQIDEKKSDISGYLEESKTYNAALQTNSAQLNVLSDEISLTESEISRLTASEDSLNTQLANTEKELFDIRKEEEVLSPLLMEARSAFERKGGEFENKLKGARYIQENLDNTQRQVEFAVNRIAENETKISELLDSQNEEAEKIAHLHEDRAEKEAQIQICLSEKDELQRSIDEKSESLYDKRSSIEDLNVQINDLQIDLKNYEFQRDNLNQKLTEIYGASLDEVKNEFGDEQANKEEVARLKRLMEGLGAINQAAPEEYDEKEQRYNFLIEQQKDLLNSRDDLQNIIRKINDSTIENFKKTFDLVRENFQKVYSRLFDGGDADLRLVDESNLLETGIEIFVQPPGKKFQSISSYSGGEKALTAVALLFAFFMVKASPFCILDEVDTSLDEANLVKYNKAVKEFAKDIQFLVITHQNISMESADVLYGVTQEEQGVSTIISAKLAKSEASAE